jgi:hypothetical protein
MLARQVVLLTSSEFFHRTQLPSRQQSTAVNPLAATLMDFPASVANRRLKMQHLQKNRGGWGVLLLTSSLCFPTFKRAFNRPLFSIASTLFHFPYPVTPLLACPPWRATPTKTAGCVPTISILELNLEICPGQSLLLFIFHQSPVTIYQSQVAHPPVPNGTGRRPLPYAYNYSAILPSSRSGGSLVPVSWRSS